ncbi:glycosyltransferase family 4 protein, partial [Patescibacteria group bacterium]|nr:glycosyltransferase family 4 protein [Patescibacteria group bacterium]
FVEKIYHFKYSNKKTLLKPLRRFYKDFSDYFILPKVNKKIAKLIDSKKYDVVLVHGDEFVQSSYLLRYLQTPSLYYCQEYLRIAYEKKLDISKNLPLLNRLYEDLTRKIRKRIDYKNAIYATKILVNSKFSQKNIESAYKKGAVINYLGCDVNVFKNNNNKRTNYLVFVGDKNKVKSYKFLKDALKLINKQIRPKILRIGFNNKHKIVSDNSLSRIYSEALVTICTAYNEPFGLSAIESMACKTPVIAVNEGGFKETLVNNRTGYLINRNKKELAKKIVYLIKHPQIINQFGKNGRERVKNMFRWEKHCSLLVNELVSIKKKNILISGLDSGGLGGAESFSLQLSKSFINKGYKTFLASVEKTKFNKKLIESNQNILEVPFRMDILGYKKGLIKFILLFIPSTIINLRLLIMFKRKGGKTIIIPGFSDKLLLSFLAKLLDLKVIWIEYANPDSLFKRNFGIPRFLYNLSIQFIDKLIVPTNYLKNEFILEKKFKKDLIQVIPCGIEILPSEKIDLIRKKKEIIKNKLGIKGKKVIGMVSRLEEGKGQDILLRAIPFLKKRFNNFVVVFAGEGNYKELKNLAKKLQIQDCVKFLGFYKDKYELISAFDVFVFPTKWELEGFGLVSLEAMLMKVPLITGDLERVKEVVGDSALISKIRPKDLSKNIIKVLSDKRLREKLIKKGSKRVNTLYNINNIADQYLKLID